MRSQKVRSFRRFVRVCCLAGFFMLRVAPAFCQDVLTYHGNNSRTGLYSSETILTPSNVNFATFGKLFTASVDGLVDAQPLYLSKVTVQGGTHNLLIVATEHDSVYAFDADGGELLWHITTLKAGETTSDDRGCAQVTPEIGITSTPVIMRPAGSNGVIYTVAMSKTSAGAYRQRLHALDAATGNELFNGPIDIAAKFPGVGDNSSGGFVVFDPGQYEERAGLLLSNGVIYMSWTSHCDIRPYTGWIMGYDAVKLSQKTILNLTPNGKEGSIWQAGAGPAADAFGNIFLLDANGTFDATLNGNGFPSTGDYGNAFLKLSTTHGLAVADYFEMSNGQQESAEDKDLGSGGTLLLPDIWDSSGNVWQLAAGAGKDSNLYLVNRNSMGKFDSIGNNIYQELTGVLPGGIWSMPAYFNNRLYYGPVGQPLLAFQFKNAKLMNAPVARTTNTFDYPGATPSISSNPQGSNAIVWAAENLNHAVLHAYNATTLVELYNSNQAPGGRDHFGSGNKFITPMIANGKVYVGTKTGVGVFGLLP